jgi:hypothetical protein
MSFGRVGTGPAVALQANLFRGQPAEEMRGKVSLLLEFTSTELTVQAIDLSERKTERGREVSDGKSQGEYLYSTHSGDHFVSRSHLSFDQNLWSSTSSDRHLAWSQSQERGREEKRVPVGRRRAW